MRSRRSAKREGGRIPSPPPKSLNGQLFSCSGRAAAGPATGRALGQVANRSQTSRSGDCRDSGFGRLWVRRGRR
jgi:hypothetical protein